jgi:hypothetical protein
MIICWAKSSHHCIPPFLILITSNMRSIQRHHSVPLCSVLLLTIESSGKLMSDSACLWVLNMNHDIFISLFCGWFLLSSQTRNILSIWIPEN